MTSVERADARDEAVVSLPSRIRRLLRVVIGLGLAGVLLLWGLPYFARTTWAEVFAVMGIPLESMAAHVSLVALGLYCYTATMTASLPGLSRYQALVVVVCGASVSNLLPGGGAAGLAATYTICRSWGFSRRDVSTSAIVTGLWNTMARVALPVLAILGLWLGAREVPSALQDAALAAIVSGVALFGAFVAILTSERAALVLGHGLDRLLGPLLRTVRRTGAMTLQALVIDQRARIGTVVRSGWLRMSLGLVGFFGIYFVLFVLCLLSTGVQIGYGQLFAAYAIGRLLTAVGVTPGGLGVTETATAAVLVSWGAGPAEATAAVVLFTLYTHLLLVPLGGIGWLTWSVTLKKARTSAERQAAPHLVEERRA